MKVRSKTKQKARRVHVELDGDKVVLPDDMENSLVAIRAYLEFMALQKRRVLSGFVVDGVEVRHIVENVSDAFKSIQADTITFEQLSLRWVDTACAQLHRLAEEMNDAVLRVLINERDAVHRQWNLWVGQFRSPLIELGFLRQLWGGRVDEVLLGSVTLTQHFAELNPLLDEVNSIFVTTEHGWEDEDAIAISAMLEDQLVPWIKMLEVYLLKLSTLPLA